MKDLTLPGFKNLSPADRRAAIASRMQLTAAECELLSGIDALPVARADSMIENVVGTFALPFGVATNFVINGRDYLVPMAIEEPSVVAAASFMAKIARQCGGFTASSDDPLMRAQVQALGIADPEAARRAILARREEIIAAANACDRTLVELGGGCRDLQVHVFGDSPRGPMAVAHLIVDVRDAMGANAVNTMAERVAPLIERITGGRVRLRILSNLADLRLARARIELTPQALASAPLDGARVIDGMLDAFALAAVDPYRAATHNKGIMNGVDPVVIATGNDWRAIEAGAHAYAARSGRYGALTTWEANTSGGLVGAIEMPMAVGLVGGATRSHPAARLAVRLLGVRSARELAEVIVTVGLAQNMAALRALSTEGIQRGHMELHARNLAIAAGAAGDEIDVVAAQIVAARDVRADAASRALAELRKR